MEDAKKRSLALLGLSLGAALTGAVGFLSGFFETFLYEYDAGVMNTARTMTFQSIGSVWMLLMAAGVAAAFFTRTELGKMAVAAPAVAIFPALLIMLFSVLTMFDGLVNFGDGFWLALATLFGALAALMLSGWTVAVSALTGLKVFGVNIKVAPSTTGPTPPPMP